MVESDSIGPVVLGGDARARHPGGAPVAADRDPDAVCGAPTDSGKGPPCNSWAVNGTGRCRMHGGGTPAAKDKAIVAKVTTDLGLPMVPTRDWVEQAGQIVARLQHNNDRMDADLEKRRLLDLDELGVQREYADIFQTQRDNIATMAKVAGSVARLSAAKAANTAADAGAEFLRSQSFAMLLAAMDEALAPYPEAQAALADHLMAMVSEAS